MQSKAALTHMLVLYLQHSPHPLVGAMSGSGGSGHFAAAGFDPRAPPPGGLGMPSQALPSHLQTYPQYAGLPYLSEQQQQQHQQQQELYAQQLAPRCVAGVWNPDSDLHACRTCTGHRSVPVSSM